MAQREPRALPHGAKEVVECNTPERECSFEVGEEVDFLVKVGTASPLLCRRCFVMWWSTADNCDLESVEERKAIASVK
jgi:hypothetical protein